MIKMTVAKFPYFLPASIALATLLCAANVHAQKTIEKDFDVERANTLLAVDIVHTAAAELIVTDVRGNVRICDASSLEILKSTSLGNDALTAATVGDFTGTGVLDIAVGTAKGEVVILNGRTLDKIASKIVGEEFNVQPTVYSTDGAAARVALVDQNGRIIYVALESGKDMAVRWEFSTGTRPAAPLTVGPIRKKGVVDFVGTTADGRIALISEPDGRGELVLVQQNSVFSQSPLLYDLDGDGRCEVFAISDTGQLFAMSYDENAAPKLRKLWTAALSNLPVGAPILITKGATGASPLIAQVTENSLAVLDPKTGRIIVQSGTQVAGVTGAAALVPRTDRYPEIGLIEMGALECTVNLQEWIESAGTQSLSLVNGSVSRPLGNSAVSVLQDGSPAILGISSDNEGVLFSLPLMNFLSDVSWPTSSPWMTAGGDSAHRSALNIDAALKQRDAAAAQEATRKKLLTEFESAFSARDWPKAQALADQLTSADPYSIEFSRLRRRIITGRYLIAIIAGLLATIGAIAVTIFLVIRVFGAKRLQRRAEAAMGRGDYNDAEKIYATLIARRPADSSFAVARAKAAIASSAFSSQSEAIYKAALAVSPGDQEILVALARAYVATQRLDAEAMDVYTRTLSVYPEPYQLEYLLGVGHLKQGNFEEAGKRLRAALRAGMESEDLYRSLCDVYLRTKNYSAKSLPIFQQQYASRQEDVEFLQGYLACCIQARVVDSRVESLCTTLLGYDPDDAQALLALAMIMMQRGQFPQAVEKIERALKANHDNTEAQFLLAQCYISLNRRDDQAAHLIQKVLAANLSDPNLLKYVAGFYAEKNRSDDSAAAIYQRAIVSNPNDMVAMRAQARAAIARKDDALAIKSLEAIAATGPLAPELTQQLAGAYARRNFYEPRTEAVYREALRHSGDSPDLIAALARTCATQEKDDRECISQYEKHLQNVASDLLVGKQYAKAMVRLGHYEKARTVAADLLKYAPDDEDLQRLLALASLYDNKVGAAALEYRRLLERNPNDQEALINLALAFIRQGVTTPEDLDICQRAASAQPENEAIHLGLGRLYGLHGDAVRSVESFKTALKLKDHNQRNIISHVTSFLNEKPEMLRVRWFLIEMMVAFGYLREALEHIQYVAQNHPGQMSNILRALETILAKDQNNVSALAERGSILLSSGQTTEGVRALEKAFTLQPASADVQDRLIAAYQAMLQANDLPETRFKLGKIFYTRGDFDQAIGAFQKTAQLSNLDAESTKFLGKCFTGKGMLDLALQEYKKLVVDNETKELLYDLAQRYEQKRDLVGAKTVYRQLFAADIDYKDVKSRFELLSGSTSDPMAFEKTSIVQQMSEEAARRYELLDELGRGAMGIVYRARDKELEEIVALKILPDNLSNNPEAVRRFKIEARNARKLSHPHIVRIHDIGEEMGRKYISMEYVDGTDLKRRVKSAPDFQIPKKDVIHYSIQISDALNYAHKLGIVHRDVKPANIMLTKNDDVKITDFGIAKMMDQTGESTMLGAVIGTPLYMSPEQVQGRPVDNRADIYSFGVLLYELLNGRPPFTEGDLAYQHINVDPLPIPGVDDALWAIVLKCLQKDKEQRWRSAEVISDALKEYGKKFKDGVV